MGSPFPGMDPYLEPFWGDVRTRLVVYARDRLQELLPRDLRARIQERCFVDLPRTAKRERVSTAAVVGATQPLILQLLHEPVTETFIEILDIGSGRRVVTAIEVLSPANKRPGEGRKLYLKRQEELLEAAVSLVEVDLLRDGVLTLAVDPAYIPPTHRTPYRVLVRRSWKSLEAEYYAISLRERLPAIRIPLRATDTDVVLDLQPLLNQCYESGAYDDDLDYEGDPVPAWTDSDAAWAGALLREKGRRLAPPRRPRPRRKN